MIRPYHPTDWPAVWSMLQPVFREGTTYAYPTDTSEEEAHEIWITRPAATFVATDGGELLGTYYLKPNQPGQGSHVCNCGYIVSPAARGRGIASEMCIHSQQQAAAMGYRGMQFNLVVSTNETAVRLWRKLGFHIIGTIPGGYHHATLGYVDAHIMHKDLTAP